nr:hypothetical protein OJOKFFHK_00048 [uncultured bacterium]
MQASSGWWVALYLLGVAIALIYLVKFALWKIRAAKQGRSIYLTAIRKGLLPLALMPQPSGKLVLWSLI